MHGKKHLSEVVEGVLEEEKERLKKDKHHAPGHEMPGRGIKIVINAGGPRPMPMPMPVKPLVKKVKKAKKAGKALGPMESALAKAY